ncbi:MAG: integrase [Comamonadaceae bacterium CG12_big_fil_rev_8_21_14_0_65_59_15]|nr:MAG: integrase [Comamonadaceae bacterium CG12_big_fil_rev_8_21_14_0_65_59_15]
MANFRKRESGLWQATVRMTGYPSQSKTFERKIDAEIWARKIEADIDRGIYQNSSDAEKTTLSDLIDRFKNEYAPFHYRKREDEKESWRYQLARLDSLLGKYSLVAIDQKVVGVYRDLRLAGNKQTKMPAVSNSTVRKEIFMLSKLMKFAQIECGIMLPRGNPVDNVRKPSEGKGRERRLTKEEFARLETEIKKSRNKLLYPAFQFAIETAARQNEILSLTWEHVNLDRKFALLKDTKNGEERAAPLSSKAIEVLNALPKPPGKLNPSDRPFPMDRTCLLSVFRYASQRAKIQDFTWHDLRHEAMSRLSEKSDFSILELASISGHKTLQMLKKYTHLQAEKLAEKMG